MTQYRLVTATGDIVRVTGHDAGHNGRYSLSRGKVVIGYNPTCLDARLHLACAEDQIGQKCVWTTEWK